MRSPGTGKALNRAPRRRELPSRVCAWPSAEWSPYQKSQKRDAGGKVAQAEPVQTYARTSPSNSNAHRLIINNDSCSAAAPTLCCLVIKKVPSLLRLVRFFSLFFPLLSHLVWSFCRLFPLISHAQVWTQNNTKKQKKILTFLRLYLT